MQFYEVLEYFLSPIVAGGDIFAYLCGPFALFFHPNVARVLFEFETPGLNQVDNTLDERKCVSTLKFFHFASTFFLLSLIHLEH